LNNVDPGKGVFVNNRYKFLCIPAFQKTAFERPVRVDTACRDLGIKKTAGPFALSAIYFNKLTGGRFDFAGQRRKGRFTFSDGYEVFSPYQAGIKESFVFMMQNRAALSAACAALYTGCPFVHKD
jgi:hypothetical protein